MPTISYRYYSRGMHWISSFFYIRAEIIYGMSDIYYYPVIQTAGYPAKYIAEARN